jgi:hypothetical protein
MKYINKFNENDNDDDHRVNDEFLYHIFKVYDYKGGELLTDTNMSRIDVCEHLIELFFYNYHDLPLAKEEDEIKKAMQKIVNDNSSTCAGGDVSWCGEIFKTNQKDRLLTKVRISDFFDDIIDILRWDTLK